MTAPDLETSITVLVAEHMAAHMGNRLRPVPVVRALATVLAQTIAAQEDQRDRVALLALVKDTLAAEIASDALDRAGDKVTVGRMN
jgi:hypothetical protein